MFARWLHGLDSRNEVPTAGLIPYRLRRPRPYIYSDDEIQCILRAAGKLPSIYGLRGMTFATFFGLVAVTGMRISEAISLDLRDVDLGRCKFLSVNCFPSLLLRPFGVRRSDGERSEPSAAEPRRGEAAPRAKNWSRAGHSGFMLGCYQHIQPKTTK